jgi:viroplasmin and RNaseH domain-containing protein
MWCFSFTVLFPIFRCFLRVVVMPHYAVARGKITGVFTTWAECSNQVQGFKGAMFKKFDLESEAAEFVAKHSNGSASSSSSSAVKRQSKVSNLITSLYFARVITLFMS